MKENATAAVMEANNIIKEQSRTAANLVTGEHATIIGQYCGLSECFVNNLLSVKDQQINDLLGLLAAKDRQINALTKQLNKAPQRLNK